MRHSREPRRHPSPASQDRAAKQDVRRETRVDEAKAAHQRRSSGGEPDE